MQKSFSVFVFPFLASLLLASLLLAFLLLCLSPLPVRADPPGSCQGDPCPRGSKLNLLRNRGVQQLEDSLRNPPARPKKDPEQEKFEDLYEKMKTFDKLNPKDSGCGMRGDMWKCRPTFKPAPEPKDPEVKRFKDMYEKMEAFNKQAKSESCGMHGDVWKCQPTPREPPEDPELRKFKDFYDKMKASEPPSREEQEPWRRNEISPGSRLRKLFQGGSSPPDPPKDKPSPGQTECIGDVCRPKLFDPMRKGKYPAKVTEPTPGPIFPPKSGDVWRGVPQGDPFDPRKHQL